jgi:organic hydroperoxide reductase OsmC/OhrA
MEPFPHYYTVTGDADEAEVVMLRSAGVPDLPTTPPREFGGSGSEWSPEALLVAAVADCYILTFKALAKASKLEWRTLSCETRGTLERIEKITRFTTFDLDVQLQIAEGANESMAERLMAKAKEVCLITNSLTAQCTLTARLVE